jgi:hypothetical protein
MHKGIHTNAGADGFQIVPGKVVFDNYKFTNVLEIVLQRKAKYFLKNEYGDMYVNINYLNKNYAKNHTNSLWIVSEYIQKAMKLHISRQMIKKDVWELYICDSTRYRKAAIPMLSTETHYDLRQIGKILDSQNKENYIVSKDSIHQFCLNRNKEISFDEIVKTWDKKYGLGFRKVQQELEFIKIE